MQNVSNYLAISGVFYKNALILQEHSNKNLERSSIFYYIRLFIRLKFLELSRIFENFEISEIFLRNCKNSRLRKFDNSSTF